MHSLYSGDFVGYQVASSAEHDAALRDAIIAVDANVLLDLYRFRPQTSRDLISTLRGLQDRLVVPHQALREFWRHRQRSQASPRSATKAASDALSKSGRSMIDALTGWAKAVGVDHDELAELTGRVSDFTDSLTQELRSALPEEGDDSSDPVLQQLELLLDGRVTPPLEPGVQQECIAEAHRRIDAQQPPGYRNVEKEADGAEDGGAGDYLVWYQATRLAQERDRDLVIVTRDEKEDWWWRQQSEFLGPRPELTREYHELSGRRLFLMRPADLLARASVLEVEVDVDSTLDAGRVGDEPEGLEAVGDEHAAWTADAVEHLLTRLDSEAPVQAAALRLAGSDSSGRVSREAIYDLGDYSADRTLRGFTRPFRRLTKLLQDEGLVPADVPPIFVARYPDGVTTSYFSVPPEVPQIVGNLGSESRSALTRGLGRP